MAPARYRKTKDDDFQLSQISNEDDDGGSGALVQLLQKYQSDQEKMRKKKEVDFLRKAKQAFESTLQEHAKAFMDSMSEIQRLYDEFSSGNAAVNDRIRMAWITIYKEQERCKDICEKLARVELESQEKADALYDKEIKTLNQCLIEEEHCIDLIHASRIPG